MFKVPNEYRVRVGKLASDNSYGNNGAFVIPPQFRSGQKHEPVHRALAIIASDGLDWEHVSVHAFSGMDGKTFTPYWEEMCFVKNMFWDEEDLVIQYHPPKSQYVNVHPNALHLWRKTEGFDIPIPNIFLV